MYSSKSISTKISISIFKLSWKREFNWKVHLSYNTNIKYPIQISSNHIPSMKYDSQIKKKNYTHFITNRQKENRTLLTIIKGLSTVRRHIQIHNSLSTSFNSTYMPHINKYESSQKNTEQFKNSFSFFTHTNRNLDCGCHTHQPDSQHIMLTSRAQLY